MKKTMDSSFDDTVGPVVVVPHTVGAVRSSIYRIIDDDSTVVSVDTKGELMSVIFNDGDGGLLWYRSGKRNSDFGITQDALSAT